MYTFLILALAIAALVIAIVALTRTKQDGDTIIVNPTVPDSTVPMPSIPLDSVAELLVNFVYRPGFTGTQIGIYSDWNELMDVITQVPGERIITFNDTDGALVIPPKTGGGAYDLTNIILNHPFQITELSPISRKHVMIQDGVTFYQLGQIQGPLLLDYQGTTEPCMVYDGTTTLPNAARSTLNTSEAVAFQSTGTQPFCRVDADAWTLILGDFCDVLAGSTPCIVSNTPPLPISPVQLTLLMMLGEEVTIETNSVGRTSTSSSVLFTIYNRSYEMNQDVVANWSALQNDTTRVTIANQTNSTTSFTGTGVPTTTGAGSFGNYGETGAFEGDMYVNTLVPDLYFLNGSNTWVML